MGLAHSEAEQQPFCLQTGNLIHMFIPECNPHSIGEKFYNGRDIDANIQDHKPISGRFKNCNFGFSIILTHDSDNSYYIKDINIYDLSKNTPTPLCQIVRPLPTSGETQFSARRRQDKIVKAIILYQDSGETLTLKYENEIGYSGHSFKNDFKIFFQIFEALGVKMDYENLAFVLNDLLKIWYPEYLDTFYSIYQLLKHKDLLPYIFGNNFPKEELGIIDRITFVNKCPTITVGAITLTFSLINAGIDKLNVIEIAYGEYKIKLVYKKNILFASDSQDALTGISLHYSNKMFQYSSELANNLNCDQELSALYHEVFDDILKDKEYLFYLSRLSLQDQCELIYRFIRFVSFRRMPGILDNYFNSCNIPDEASDSSEVFIEYFGRCIKLTKDLIQLKTGLIKLEISLVNKSMRIEIKDYYHLELHQDENNPNSYYLLEYDDNQDPTDIEDIMNIITPNRAFASKMNGTYNIEQLSILIEEYIKSDGFRAIFIYAISDILMAAHINEDEINAIDLADYLISKSPFNKLVNGSCMQFKGPN